MLVAMTRTRLNKSRLGGDDQGIASGRDKAMSISRCNAGFHAMNGDDAKGKAGGDADARSWDDAEVHAGGGG